MKIVLGVYDEKPHRYHYNFIDDTWILTDINPRSNNIMRVDARSLPEGVEAIYASHIVEHIVPEEVDAMLKHWYDSLPSGGYAIINVPDIEWLCHQIILTENGGRSDSSYFTTTKKLMEVIYGNVGDTGFDKHHWGYTKNSLTDALEKAGFKVEVRREYEAHDMGCLIAKAVKE